MKDYLFNTDTPAFPFVLETEDPVSFPSFGEVLSAYVEGEKLDIVGTKATKVSTTFDEEGFVVTPEELHQGYWIVVRTEKDFSGHPNLRTDIPWDKVSPHWSGGMLS